MGAPEGFPCVLGLPIEEAKRRLLCAGALVTTVGYRSKKGVEGAEDVRVIRQKYRDGAVELVCSAFITEMKEQ